VPARRGRIGGAGRDGAVERVVAVSLAPAAAADLVQQRDGARYGFARVDLGGRAPVTVELRGTAPTGAQVIVTASTAAPVPLATRTEVTLPADGAPFVLPHALGSVQRHAAARAVTALS